MDGASGVVLAPTVYFRFRSRGTWNRTRASLPLGDGRHRDYHYRGRSRFLTMESRGFVRDGVTVYSAYRNARGLEMPAVRVTYADGVEQVTPDDAIED